MRCSKAKPLISHAMDEQLEAIEATRLAEHLQACSSCAHYERELARASELLRRAEATPSDNFEWKVQLGIQRALREAAADSASRSAPRRFWLPVGLSAVLSAAVVLAVGLSWLGGQGSDPAPDLGNTMLASEGAASSGSADFHALPVSTAIERPHGWRNPYRADPGGGELQTVGQYGTLSGRPQLGDTSVDAWSLPTASGTPSSLRSVGIDPRRTPSAPGTLRFWWVRRAAPQSAMVDSLGSH